MNREFLRSRLSLILIGIVLGWIARLVLGAPVDEDFPPRTINRPLENVAEEVLDVSLIRTESESGKSSSGETGGLVPPIQLPGTFSIFGANPTNHLRVNVLFDEQAHGDDVFFEAHGKQLCASGCALSRHPTAELSSSKFRRLIARLGDGEMDEKNEALEELIYFGGQTRKLIESHGVASLSNSRARFLWDQLTVTHAKVSIRVTDEQGEIRTWIEPTQVPFDRRHVFEMQTSNVQPLVTSGTVKRVGLNHLWVRL